MAATNLPVRQIVETGYTEVAKVSADTVNGNSFTNDGKNTWIEVQNAHATNSSTITFVTPGTVRGSNIDDVVRTVPAVTTKRFGPFPTSFYGTTVTVNTTGTGTVTMAVYAIQG